MGIKVALNHQTIYQYDRLVKLGPQVIRLRPASHALTPISSYSLKVEPKEHFLSWQQDPFGNFLARIVFPEKTRFFKVEVDLLADIRVFNPFDFFLEDEASHYPFQYEKWLEEELIPYLAIKEEGVYLKKFLTTINQKEQGLIDFLVELNQYLSSQLKYVIRMEPGIQSCEETLKLKSGSCRDMAWLLCQILRHLGLATRFTSGYLIQLKADIKSLTGPSGASEDFTDLHAWTEVYIPGAGWVGLDPTSGLFAGEGHIPLCCTPNPSSAAAITGVLGPCESKFHHTMSVVRINEERRITKPYTEKEWQEIDLLGNKIEKNIEKHNIKLTMGGEPTFIFLQDQEKAEWQVEALGVSKWDRANILQEKLSCEFAPGGFLQYGQGKWYPGELMPRWALGRYWKKDKLPLWKNNKLLAKTPSESGPTLEMAKTFLGTLAAALGVTDKMILPACEDTPYYLWKEGQLPMEGDILKANFFEKTERERLQKLLYKDLNLPVGFVLPLGYAHRRKRWITNCWKFRNDKLLLSIGDSPLGLRLPMGSLPYVEKAQEEMAPEKSPFEKVSPLKNWEELNSIAKDRYQKEKSGNGGDHLYLESDPNGFVRTALCVQAREGFLYIFLPPLTSMDNFCDLLGSIEWTAEKLQMPVRIEGYNPPFDLRVQSFKITPDPGVLEVNIHPAANWQEQVEITTTVYEQARLTGLDTNKFLLDGRRIGTGGGNHIILGGATPAESPFLRRPDLIRSFVTFWQHHPSLSYLFSSLFIGPTGPSPRIDEARHDSLYELEIAFNKFPAESEIENKVPPWLIDRLLRNLLVDITGNTHRAEFCIDKLYNPAGDSGRLGLLELRNFEMPPHPQMSLVQSLLVRACVSAFWQTPFQATLIRWGTRLHDRFMLPHFIWNDFLAVLSYLKNIGYNMQKEWFVPHFEFRFPQVGVVQIGDVEIELRTALEPWPVMGEEVHQGTVSRGVDSSVERLQVTVRGGLESIHRVVCNGHFLPLTPTEEQGTFVAGVRYKAWAPPSSLHPTIKVHTPLVFDLLDISCGRSLGGCTFHVIHPGGRSYEKVPINENEAEGRRISRFQAMGHTPGAMKTPIELRNPEFPLTLDLRNF